MNHTMTWHLNALLDFGEDKHLIAREDRAYTMNRLLEICHMDAPEDERADRAPECETATAILNAICDHAVQRGLFPDSAQRRDLFSAKLMGALTPHPQMVRERFYKLYSDLGPAAATQDFYRMCRNVDYIRVDRIAKNVRFFHDTRVGELEITINLSKPEKDPRDIAAQKNAKQTGYPKCMLCVENPGYAGRMDFPARQNHRIVPVRLNGESWYFQYSPYAYYDEHCIVFNRNHVPMRISRESFVRLFDFVDQFPHYLLGSNADLPIVGGSILSHDHFQGGGYTFPMERAGVRFRVESPDPAVEVCVADWPMTDIVLTGADREAVIALADRILTAWRGYSDPECGIFAETDGAPHNTITPIARRVGDAYRLHLVLRNNLTTDMHPLGVFHPHAELHHIKKENIGLIEVMGLFILPGRLKTELAALADYLTGAQSIECAPDEASPLAKHYAWVCDIAKRTGTKLSGEDAHTALHDALADACAQVLIDSGVYKDTESGNAGVLRFLRTIGCGDKI